jgi:hypothetical protein
MHMTSSSRRVFIGYLVLAKATKAGGDQTNTQSATSNCNTHYLVTRRLHRQHLVHPQFVKAWMWSRAGFTSWNRPTFFANGAEGVGGVRERALGSPAPSPPPGPPRRLAAQGGKGELSALHTAPLLLFTTTDYCPLGNKEAGEEASSRWLVGFASC